MARKSKRAAILENKPPIQEDNMYNVAVYTRLSIEDKLYKNGSESLTNQRELIYDYLRDKPNMKVYSVYCDNGQTGTNFDREDFQRMMYDVYNGKVNCIIVKDLSRFGREYVEAGDYLERIFPLLGIRFIAINDNYDNKVNPFNITVPIKNIINTLYARDLSKKSAAALRIKQANGEFIGAYASYGYKKSPEDKHKLIIDEETAPVVKMIFEWKADGMSNAAICRRLYDMHIVPPAKYRYDKGILKDKRYANCTFWRSATIKHILQNEMYIGNMVQGRRKSHFYDGGNYEYLDKSKWTVVTDTHEPIISKELFYKVQKQLEEINAAYHRNLGKYDKISNSNNYFKGKVICGDCGTKAIRYKTAKKGYKTARYTYICPHHANFPDKCGFMSIAEDSLKEIVMNSIRLQITHLADLENMLIKAEKSPAVRKKMMEVTKETSNILANISYIKSGRIRLATDYAKGIMTNDDYISIKSDFDSELKTETQNLEAVNKQREKLNRLLSAGKWIAELKKYKGSKKLTQEMVDAFVKQITVYPDKRIAIEWVYADKESELLVKGDEQLAG